MTTKTIGAAAAPILATMIGLSAVQGGAPKDTQLNPDRVAVSTRTIVIGCVSREGDGQAPAFAITDTRAQPAVRYQLDGDKDVLGFHAGHMVEIAGPLASGTLKVEALTYVATTCVALR